MNQNWKLKIIYKLCTLMDMISSMSNGFLSKSIKMIEGIGRKWEERLTSEWSVRNVKRMEKRGDGLLFWVVLKLDLKYDNLKDFLKDFLIFYPENLLNKSLKEWNIRK